MKITICFNPSTTTGEVDFGARFRLSAKTGPDLIARARNWANEIANAFGYAIHPSAEPAEIKFDVRVQEYTFTFLAEKIPGDIAA